MQLNSIVIPCLARDKTSFELLLSYWSDDRLFPVRLGDVIVPISLVVVLNRTDEQTVSSFSDIYAKSVKLHSVFKEFRVLGAGLEGDRDIYVRNHPIAQGVFGNKAGPNFLFFETMRSLHYLGGFTFQNEVDCFPLYRGWLTDLADLVQARRYAWVIGSFYTGRHPIGRDIQTHLNGNAIYQVGNPSFIDFVNQVWEPRLLEMVELYPNLAYDCWWSLEAHRASSTLGNSAWGIISRYSQFHCNSQFLINTLMKDECDADMFDSIRTSAQTGQRCLFAHGHAVAPLIASFIESSFVDVVSFLRKRIDVSVKAGSEWDVINTIQSLRGRIAPYHSQATSLAEATIHGDFELRGADAVVPIEIFKLPTKLYPTDINKKSFIGSWYSESIEDHIWAGGGPSGLSFRFNCLTAKVRITIHGKAASGINFDHILFHGIGASEVAVTKNREDGSVSFVFLDQDNIGSASVIIDILSPIREQGDERELGFVLFAVDIDAA